MSGRARAQNGWAGGLLVSVEGGGFGMSVYVKIKDLTRVFDVSKPWLNRVIERREKAFLTAVSEVDFEIEEKTTSAFLLQHTLLPFLLQFQLLLHLLPIFLLIHHQQ